ncbi:MAG: hypothetical protein PHD15_04190 [Clostridia bacterium]|nr:hypothetical protein [Clostridia bacterium]MDD4386940.1 hypothetical protein [Clostridia bacterium]
MENENIFRTREYNLKDYVTKAKLEEHLEYKINAVIEVHESIWTIDKIERKITDSTASATLYMTRK